MLDLNELQIFVHVARAASFTAAARALGLPKSSISRAVARLEARLGVRLLERNTRRLLLTEAGQTYLRHAGRMLDAAEEAELALGALRGRPRGLLRVGLPVTLARSFLAPLIPEFLARYPELRMHLSLRSGPIDPIEHSLDLAIQVGDERPPDPIARLLGSVPLGVYASPRHLQRSGLPGAPAELAEHACLTIGQDGRSAEWVLTRHEERVTVRLTPRFSVPDPVIHHQLAVAGLGFALLPEFLARADEQEGRLLRVLPDWSPPPVEVHALYPTRRSLTPKVRALLEFLDEKLGWLRP